MEKEIIGYRCTSDCVLQSISYYSGEEFLTKLDADAGWWPGTDFFDKHPEEFEPIYHLQ